MPLVSPYRGALADDIGLAGRNGQERRKGKCHGDHRSMERRPRRSLLPVVDWSGRRAPKAGLAGPVRQWCDRALPHRGHGSRYVTRRHSTSHRAADMPPYMLDVGISATLHIALWRRRSSVGRKGRTICHVRPPGPSSQSITAGYEDSHSGGHRKKHCARQGWCVSGCY